MIIGNIIDATYFVRKINIPNVDATLNPRNAPILERLNSFISQYEPECLTKILGYNLYNLAKVEDSQRMSDLLNGAEFTDVDGVFRKWNGLKYSPNMSLIAQYVYYKFQEDSATQTTGVSTSTNNTEGGTSVSPQYKMIDAWNCFSRETKDMVSFLWNRNQGVTPVYPEYSTEQCYFALNFSRPINFWGI